MGDPGKMDYFEFKIWLKERGPLRDVVCATSLEEALELVRLRYPGCLVEVPEPVVRLSSLAKSCDGAKKRAQRKLLRLKNAGTK